MMSTFTRPENALKKAEELIAVGQKDNALHTLHDVITSRKHRTWSKTLESIIMKYIELCVEMRKGKYAKEGLHQYKILCQQVNVGSLEGVVKHFLHLSEENAKVAQSKAQQLTLDVEDLDAEESAESIMLTAVSGEQTKDRTDREIVTPWLRFLWETYRTVLEILRNNAKMESVYHQTAEQAFNFCIRYQRKNEFRRLSDILRQHLANLGKYPNQPHNISLTVPETLQAHLETRFAQLNVATELELWQEAFRSIEDIHGLIAVSGRPAKPQMMATYYQKLAQIFWVSNNYLFHAYALYKYYTVVRTLRTFPPEELRIMASALLLSALSIPVSDPKSPDDQYFDFDIQKEKNLRMCTLLTINTTTPKREALLHDLVDSRKINNLVLPELPDLYHIVENKFQPLQLCTKMQEKFDFLETIPQLKQYIRPLQKLTLLRVIQQLSTVYESMKMSQFTKLAGFMDAKDLEKYLVDLVKRKVVSVRVDHQSGALHFGNKAEQLRGQLTSLAKDLQHVAKLIAPTGEAPKTQDKDKRDKFVHLINALKNDHAWITSRKVIIEKKKEYRENKERETREKEEAARKAAEAKKPVAPAPTGPAVPPNPWSKTPASKLVGETAGEVVSITPDPTPAAAPEQALIESKIAELAKFKQEQAKRVEAADERIRYLERARRKEEKPLLQAQHVTKREEDKAVHKENTTKFFEEHKTAYERDLAEKQRLSRMTSDRAAFEEKIMSRRRQEFTVKKAEQDTRLAEIRVKLEEDRQRRAQEAAERRAEEDRLRKIKEEDERQRREVEQARRAEDEARNKKMEEMAEKQRQRELEVIAKQRKEEEDEKKAREEREASRREPVREERREPFRDDRRDDGQFRRPERDDGFRRPERDDGFRRPGGDEGRRDFGRDEPYRPNRDRDDRPPREEGDRFDRRNDAYRPPGRDRDARGGGGEGMWGNRDRDSDRPSRDMDRPPRDMDRPPRDMDRPPRDMDRPPRDMDRPPRDMDRPPRDSGDRFGDRRAPPPSDRDRMDRDRPRPMGGGGGGGGGGWRDERDAPARREPFGERGAPRRDDRDDRPPPRRDDRDSAPPAREREGREREGRERERETRDSPAQQRQTQQPTKERNEEGSPEPAQQDGFTTVSKGRRKK